MTLGGWIILTLSVGGTTAFFIWCLHRVLAIPGETEHIHGFGSEQPVNLNPPEDPSLN